MLVTSYFSRMKSKKISENREISHAYGLAELTYLKWPYSWRQTADSMQTSSISQQRHGKSNSQIHLKKEKNTKYQKQVITMKNCWRNHDPWPQAALQSNIKKKRIMVERQNYNSVYLLIRAPKANWTFGVTCSFCQGILSFWSLTFIFPRVTGKGEKSKKSKQ